jgi:hypothetical protein
MMKVKEFFKDDQPFLTGFLMVLITAGLLQLLGYFWDFAWILMVFAGFLGGILVKKAGKAFLVGLIGVLVAWLIYFLIYSYIGPLWAFADLLAGLFGLSGMGFVVIVLALVLIGGLIGGLGALNGHFIASIILSK